jgi:Glycosyl hydrolase catalytic core
MKKKFNLGIPMLICVLAFSCKEESLVEQEMSMSSKETSFALLSPTALTVSQNLNQTTPKTDVNPDVIYNAPNVGGSGFQGFPVGYNDNIESFNLPQGYMVTFAENGDGTGESICYVAATGPINQNLPTRLRNKVSYIRYIPIDIPNKKGVAQTNIEVSTALGATWFYNWGNGANSTATQQYVPMTWGKNSANPTTALNMINKDNVSHLLSFNEPDNVNQSNITNIDTAVARYKIMMRTGLRLGSPVTEQDNALGAGKWLTEFMAKAATEKARVDYVVVHWYDWGNQTQTGATDDATATGVLNRLKTYLGKIHTAYPNHPIWITEFNANPTRTSVNVHKLFMQKAVAWLNTTDYVERYSYFFPNVLPPTSGAPDYTLTTLGQTWRNLASPATFSANVVPN